MAQTQLTDIPTRKNSWLKAPFLVGKRVLTERKLQRRGLRFRAADPDESAYAYNEMEADEFATINACQEWANWRTIPRLIHHVDSQEPWFIIDLGCGQGLSTEALAWCIPPNSRILGYDLSDSALKLARSRQYRHATGERMKVAWRIQAIDQPWLDHAGKMITEASVTVVNASGIVGHHLGTKQVQFVAAEISRALVPGGWAFLDVGPRIRRTQLREIMESSGFRYRGHIKSCWLDPYGQSAFQVARSSK